MSQIHNMSHTYFLVFKHDLEYRRELDGKSEVFRSELGILLTINNNY